MARIRDFPFANSSLGAALQIAADEGLPIDHIFKFGFNGDIDTAEETIWDGGGIYSYPASAETMTVSSESANDTSDGTGARTVQVQGLDTNYKTVLQEATLNGQTEVALATDLIRVFRIIVLTAGSGNENADTIHVGSGTVTSGVPANSYAQVLAGENQTLMGIYTIPAGHTGYFGSIFLSASLSANSNVTFRVLARPDGGVFNVKNKLVLSGQALPREALVYDVFPEKTDIEIRALSSANNADASAGFTIILVKDNE